MPEVLIDNTMRLFEVGGVDISTAGT